MNFLRQFLAPDAYQPHGYSRLWNSGQVWLHAVSNLVIGAAYFATLIALVLFVRRRRDLRFRWMFLAFGVFIFACASSYLMEAWNVWHADYWLAGGIEAITAAASILTTMLVYRLVAHSLALPRREDLLQANVALESAVQERTSELLAVNKTLREEINIRRAAEETHRRSAQSFRSLVEDAPFGICRTTPEGRFLFANPALVRMLGYGSAKDLKRIDPITALWGDPGQWAGIHQNFLSAKTAADAEADWLRRDGQHITVRLVGRAIKDSTDAISSFEMIVENVTQRRALERQVIQMQKMEAIGRLAGGIAHDFNNLLGIILGYTETLQDGLPPDDALRKSLHAINEAANRAADLTRQLLVFGRQQTLDLKPIDLNVIVSSIVDLLRRLIGEQIEFSMDLEPHLGAVKSDPIQMQQVIMNLAINARDAMPRGGNLFIQTANTVLDELAVRQHPGLPPGTYVLLAISDTGAGMDAETQARIFEPFFTTKEKGTGLGLATAYGIIRQSGGDIWVYSEAGRGATFKIYLPLLDSHPARQTAPTQGQEITAGTETILVTEDAEPLRAFFCGSLEKFGYRVLGASSWPGGARDFPEIFRPHRLTTHRRHHARHQRPRTRQGALQRSRGHQSSPDVRIRGCRSRRQRSHQVRH